MNNTKREWSPADAERFKQLRGRYPTGYKPNASSPETIRTEGERSAVRFSTKDWLPEEREAFKGVPYLGTGVASRDSAVVDRDTGIFGGMFAQRQKQQTPLAMVRDSNALAKENALSRLIRGEPLSIVDSMFVKSYLPTPEKPEKPKAYDPSAALADSTAQWQLDAVAGIPGAEEKLKRHAGIKEAMSAKTKPESDRITQKDYLGALKRIADLKIKLSYEEDPGAKAAMQEELDETTRTHVRYRAQLLSDKYPPSSVRPGTIKQDTKSGYYFQSDGTQWKRIIPPQQ